MQSELRVDAGEPSTGRVDLRPPPDREVARLTIVLEEGGEEAYTYLPSSGDSAWSLCVALFNLVGPWQVEGRIRVTRTDPAGQELDNGPNVERSDGVL